jgi:Uma2 family endonuclease
MRTVKFPVTAEDLLHMPGDGVRRELMRGEVREMPPAGGEHGSTSMGIGARLYILARERKLGTVFGSDTGFVIERDPDTVLAPDCAFVRAGRLPRPIPKGFLPLAPDLVVETVSPGDRPGEVREKTERWLEAGVGLLWTIDPGRRTVTIHKPGAAPRAIAVGDFLEGEEVLPGFRVAVADLFD